MRNDRRVTGAAFAVFAVALSACGDRSDSASPNAPAAMPVAPASAAASAPAHIQGLPNKSSLPCVNEADYRVGTVLDVDGTSTTAGQAPTQTGRITTVTERKPFAGATPLVLKVQDKLPGGAQPVTAELYMDKIGDKLLSYGTYSDVSQQTITQTYKPGVVGVPVDMQPGETSISDYETTTVIYANPDKRTLTVVVDVSRAITYNGREILTTALGTFNVCKFTTVTTSTRNSVKSVSTATAWRAAEGPYRGQNLKTSSETDGRPSNGFEVTRMTYKPAG